MEDQPSFPSQGLTYVQAGVDAASKEEGLQKLLSWVGRTSAFRKGIGAPVLDIGHFANVLDIGHGLGLAISTDNVGTKVLIAQMVGKYDTLGVDCVAVNVNDVLCVGAEPIALVDYIAVAQIHATVLEEMGKGMYLGAQEAGIAIVGGEVAQVPDLVKGPKPGYAFDLSATCVGIVPLGQVVVGRDIREGDRVIGLASSGIHCNGLSLARKALLEGSTFKVDTYVPELGKTVGEELLAPTRIYVAVVMEMLRAGLRIKALAHISGGGLTNLSRVEAPVGFVLQKLPEPPAIFSLIQRTGQVSDAEMYTVFNMGIGFCVVVDPTDAASVLEIATRHGIRAYQLGYAVADPAKKVLLKPKGLVGVEGRFQAAKG
ncbi:MAG: phosphoribosylformylglycinamidine cyclo-ligase [Dehalococcoidia bacterium]|nr:phosphoribosylformylglycinamidine cyclo-ligase [Dehalococcoidia bacterium]